MDLTHKNIAILGAGTSGLSAGRLASARGGRVTVFDSASPDRLAMAAEQLEAAGLAYVFGDDALSPAIESAWDLVVVSPGIDTASPIAEAFASTGASLIGEIELAWRCDPDPTIVAITGTNGKTTTTELVAHLLNETGLSSVATGNYGRAYTDVVLAGERYDAIALELSSFQLETIDQFHPEVAVWMNFAADHMDRYRSLEDYRNAKLRIFENMNGGDLAITNAADGPGIDLPCRQTTFTAFEDASAADWQLVNGAIVRHGETVLEYGDTLLRGRHNAENLMAALAAGEAVGASVEAMVSAAKTYRAPSHRCEFIDEVDGVTFINDSKATNLHAMRSSLRGQEKPVVLIVGGKNKGLDFSEISDLIPAVVTHVVAIGEMADAIVDAWSGLRPCEKAASMGEAVDLAAKVAVEGQTVLLSPGTSSFDMFASYEARGESFRESVQQHKTTQP